MLVLPFIPPVLYGSEVWLDMLAGKEGEWPATLWLDPLLLCARPVVVLTVTEEWCPPVAEGRRTAAGILLIFNNQITKRPDWNVLLTERVTLTE
jgi:hypothetical protein